MNKKFSGVHFFYCSFCVRRILKAVSRNHVGKGSIFKIDFCGLLARFYMNFFTLITMVKSKNVQNPQKIVIDVFSDIRVPRNRFFAQVAKNVCDAVLMEYALRLRH